MLRLAGAVVAAAGLLVATPVAGQPSAPTPTRIVLSPRRQPVSYTHRQVTFTGVLETWVRPGQTAQTLPDEPVQVTLEVAHDSVTIPIENVTTGAKGRFTVTTTVPVPGAIFAAFAGTTAYRPSKSSAAAYRPLATLLATDLPARVTFNPIAPVPVYSTATVTGQVTMEFDGNWIPSPYAYVRPVGGENITFAGFTNASGQFSETFRVDPGHPLQLSTYDIDGSAWSGTAFSPRLAAPLTTFPARVDDFPRWRSESQRT